MNTGYSTISGYKIVKTIASTESSSIFLGKSDYKTAILKIGNADKPNVNNLRIRNEFNILNYLKQKDPHATTVKLEHHQSSLVLVLENETENKSFLQVYKPGLESIETFLDYSIKISNALIDIHSHGIIHKDIKPDNFVIDERGLVKIIDFGISSRVAIEYKNAENISTLEGTIEYMSPEQTRRMNRPIDYRTDLYSLGVTFYQMLTGQLPFSSKDAIELIYFHLAQLAQSPHELNKHIPNTLSKIVMKLLSKNAENRYSSVHGLKKDLEKCQTLLTQNKAIADFELGLSDVHFNLNIPQKLYGRSHQIEQLLKLYELASTGTSELLFISGYSGIGKTVLVNELQKPVTKNKGIFISGKFNQFEKNIPYNAIIQIFTQLTRNILSEPPETIAIFKKKILTALEGNGKLLTDFIPELINIIDTQPTLSPLNLMESKNRLTSTFHNFATCFASKEHPLVIFLDDLQWADLSSLDLLKKLSLEGGCLLIVGSYRENEVDSNHPLKLTINDIKKIKQTHEIVLPPLKIEDVVNLLSDCFQSTSAECSSLAQIICEKTNGNPFFITEFLKYLFKENILSFDTHKLKWIWDTAKINSLNVSDNVVELISKKISLLDDSTQNLLTIASFLGSQFNLYHLSIVSKLPAHNIIQKLWPAVQSGIITTNIDFSKLISLSDNQTNIDKFDLDENLNFKNIVVKFNHDKIRQASFERLKQQDALNLHWTIGHNFLNSPMSEGLMLEIANHLNKAVSLAKSSHDKHTICKINLEAAKKSQEATAYKEATEYVTMALELLKAETENEWAQDYNLMYSLHTIGGRCFGLLGQIEKSEVLLDHAINHSLSPFDKGQVYAIKLNQLAAVGRYIDATNQGLTALNLLGINLPSLNSAADIQKHFTDEFTYYSQWRSQNSLTHLFDLPTSDSKEQNLIISICASMLDCVFISASYYYGIMAITMINQSIKNGNTPLSAIGYQSIGIVLSAGFQNYDDAYELGVQSLKLNDLKFHNSAISCNLAMVFGAMFLPLKENYSKLFNLYERSYSEGINSGDHLFSAYSAIGTARLSVMWGNQDLAEVKENYEKQISRIKKTNNFAMLEMINSQKADVLNLFGQTDNIESIDYDNFKESEYREMFKGVPLFIAFYNMQRITRLFLYEQFEKASEVSLNTDFSSGLPMIMDNLTFNYFSCLSHLHVLKNNNQHPLIEKLNAAINTHYTIIQKLAVSNPSNFKGHELHLAAEIAELKDEDTDSIISLYEQSLDFLQKSNLPFFIPIVKECTALFAKRKKHRRIFSYYMYDAFVSYVGYKMNRKANLIQSEYPNIFLQKKNSENSSLDPASTTSILTTQMIDLDSFSRASQIISGEIIKDKLIVKLMNVLKANAGAPIAALIIKENDTLHLKAYSKNNYDKFESVPLESFKDFPHRLFMEIKSKTDATVIDNALENATSKNDQYILKNDCKSIFILPIINQGRLQGYLYLENPLSTGAFSNERISSLKILASQAAVSLENAMLYSDLEQRVLERTEELNQSLISLKEAQAKLSHTSKMSALGVMASGIAHEINSPLATIRLNAERLNIALKKNNLNPETIDQVTKKVISTVDRIAKIIQGLRQFSREGSTDPVATITTGELVDQTLSFCQEKFKHSDVELILQGNTELSKLPTLCKTTQVSQVILNLLNNAFDAVQEYETKWVKIEFSETETMALIRVVDSGHGISESVREKLFQPFFTTKEIGKGTGLGLSISKGIMDSNEGSLTYELYNNNTSFVISIPKFKEDDSEKKSA